MDLQQRFLTNNPCYRANLTRADSRYVRFQNEGPKGLMLHSVGCAQPSAEVFARKWDRPEAAACVHAFIDGNTGRVLQTLPWTFRGWHGGGSSNDTHIGVELCEPDAIRYESGGRFTVLDREKAVACARRTYCAAVELFAHLCAVFSLDPLRDICSHREGGQRGIATSHVDPEHLWQGLGLDYTMEGFRRDTAAFGKENAMTREELTALVDSRIGAALEGRSPEQAAEAAVRSALGPQIDRIGDLRQASLRKSVRELLDCGAVNGGTPEIEDPDDIRLPYQILRAVLISKVYADRLAGELRAELQKESVPAE